MTSHRDPGLWVLVALTAVAAVAGALSGVLMAPETTRAVLVSAAVQVVATAAIPLLLRRPVVVALVVAVACLSTTFLDPSLTSVAARGVSGWAPLAITTAAQLLFRFARDPVAATVGTGGLVLASVAPVAVNLAAGAPPFAAVLAGAVPLLAGALIATRARLDDARRDRLTRDDQLRTGDGGVHTNVALAVLRLEQLTVCAPDRDTRRAAGDVAHLLQAAATGHDSAATIRVEVLPAGRAAPATADALPAGEPTAPEPAAPEPLPGDLPERERAILRLVATGAPNGAIARDLYLSEATVKQYVSRLMRRFDCDNRTQLALRAHPWFRG